MTIAVDPLSTTMERNFGAGGRRGTLSVDPCTGARTRWNEMHCHVLRRVGVDAPTHRIVVFCERTGDVAHLDWDQVGCAMLIAMRDDRPAGRADCERSRRELVANLGDPIALVKVEEALSDAGPHLFLVVDVLDQLGDPRPFLRVVRKLLKRNADSRLIIGALERPAGDDALPPDARYRRRWTGEEFANFLAAAGFERHSGAADGDGRSGMVVTEVGCTRGYYDRFLEMHRLPPASSRLMLVSTDTDDRETDNIERYIVELGRQTDQPPIVLTAGGPFLDALSGACIRAEYLAEWDEPWTAPDGLLEAVLHVVFLYDEVQQIEFHDYGGAFFRVPQAKRAGLIPPTVECVVVCHGCNFYIERMTKEFQPATRNLRHLWEKIAIELADGIVFPTEHARWLYLDQLGLRPLGDTLVRPLPYMWTSDAGAPWVAGSIDTIGFLGDRRRTNGWREFCEAVEELFGDEGAAETLGLRRVVVVGTGADGPPLALPPHVLVEEIHPSPEALVDVLKGLSTRSLMVIARPYNGYPYPLLQALDAGCPVLAMNGGGIEELFPSRLPEDVLCAPRAADLHQALRRALAQSPARRAELVAALRQALHSRQDAANASWRAVPVPKPILPDFAQLVPSLVTVVVPVYNRPFGEIEDLIVGLNIQVLPPFEVIFVDDASRDDFAEIHAERIRSLLRMPARFIRHAQNKGLAGARNTGFQACTTEFVCVHDSDNVAANDFLYRGCVTLLANPQLDAVNFYLSRFSDGDDWTCSNSKPQPYRPVGDGLVESLGHVNWLGDAMGVYRVAALRELGGWDDTDRAMWEDLAMYLHMLASKRRLMCIPQCEVMYRVRLDSMLRTGSEYDARQRMGRFLHGLTTFDAFCIQRLVNDWMQQQRLIYDQEYRINEQRHRIDEQQRLIDDWTQQRDLESQKRPLPPRQLIVAAVRQYLADKPMLWVCARTSLVLALKARAVWRSLRRWGIRNRAVPDVVEVPMGVGMKVDLDATREIAREWRQNPYYDRAELQDWLDTFWADDSQFRAKFAQLDVSCLVDLACGHGRHAAQIITDPRLTRPRRMILMDVNSENIEYCRHRFASQPTIEVRTNNGVDFAPLQNGSVSAVICWDAMVHFEFDCVISYIRDAHRILKPNGRALFHHSNYMAPGTTWLYNPHGRNFMSRELFAHAAMRAGLRVVDQVIMNWGTGEAQYDRLDCLSLLEKPADAEPPPVRASLPRRAVGRLNRLRREWLAARGPG